MMRQQAATARPAQHYLSSRRPITLPRCVTVTRSLTRFIHAQFSGTYFRIFISLLDHVSRRLCTIRTKKHIKLDISANLESDKQDYSRKL